MRVVDFLLVATWLASRVTAKQPICTPPKTWPKDPVNWGFQPWHSDFESYPELEITVPEKHKTADVLTDDVYEYITFNGHTVLHVRTPYGNDSVCPLDTNEQRSSFKAGIRFWTYLEIRELLYSWKRVRYELVDTNSTVRGITVSHARLCLENGSVQMDFYYTNDDIGVRIVISGENISTVNYEFLASPETPKMKIPRGVICKDIPYGIKQRMPHEFASFSAAVVMIYSMYNVSTYREEFYDDELRLASSVVLILPGTTFTSRFGHRYVRIIRDFNTGLRYVIDIGRQNCTVESISTSSSSHIFAGPWDPLGDNQNQSFGLFDVSGFGKFYYEGRVTERDHQADLYKASRTDWPQPGVRTTVEMYYTEYGWRSTRSQTFRPTNAGEFNVVGGWSQLFGFRYETTAAPKSMDEVVPNSTHVYGYVEEVNDFAVFDISPCYKPTTTKRLIFSFPECYGGLVRYRPKLLETVLRDYVAKATGIELIRVGEIEIVLSSSYVVDIWVTLFDIPNVTGNVPGSLSGVSLDDAVSRLKEALDSRPIVVSYEEGEQALVAIRGSLRTEADAASFVAEIARGHSTGTMAAVAAATLFLGLVIGLAASVWLWRRSQSPYLVQ